MITPADFELRFPEFIETDENRIQLFIDDATLILNESFWGLKYDMGLSYYSAHLLKIALRTEPGLSSSANNVGPISSKSVDGVSVSYAISSSSSTDTADDFLKSTVYGQRYLSLRKTLGTAAMSI